MNRKISKAAALIMAAMLAGTACAPVTVFAAKNTSETQTQDDAGMKAALTKVKQRVKIPEKLSEFEYATRKNYGLTTYDFEWHTPADKNGNYDSFGSVTVSIIGNIITHYSSNSDRGYSNEPKLAKLTNAQLLEKAKGYLKQLDPAVYDKVKFEVNTLNLRSSNAIVTFNRYENGILVRENGGYVSVDKNTGELIDFDCDWWEDASFADAKKAKTEDEIKTAYKSLCKLTPYYVISSEWDAKTQKSKKTVNIIYQPDMTTEIDAFTGEKSTIWEDMNKAKGHRYYGSEYGSADDVEEEEGADVDTGADVNPATGISFTAAETKKIQQDNNLIKTDKAFEMLKKDKYIALTDGYKLDSYNVYSEKDEKDKETFYMNLRYKFDEAKKDSADSYYNGVNVRMNAETGEIISMNKYGYSSKKDLPKLEPAKANAIASIVAKTYAKDIASGYRSDPHNADPANVWYEENIVTKAKKVAGFETSRNFVFNRYVNDIQVRGDRINVTVDSLGNVTSFGYNHTENVTFPAADILSTDAAFDKLYTQQKFNCYYDGWMTDDGKAHTYLIYKMDGFYLNAKTGALCSWSGGKTYSYKDVRKVKYTDIKGIPQEEAITTLQKYGVGITTESKFDPKAVITEAEFSSLLSSALGGYVAIAYEEPDVEDVPVEEVDVPAAKDAEAAKKAEAEKKDKAETTREEAAVIFTNMYDSSGIAKLKGIFRSPFSDVKSTDENVGYIAVAYAKGFFPKTADGKFNGSKKITRAEAAQMVYDYLKLLSK